MLRGEAAFRWSVGALFAVLALWVLAIASVAVVRDRVSREVILGSVAALWVLVGAVAFLMRREVGRRVLLGTTTALGMFLLSVGVVAWRHLGSWRAAFVPWIAVILLAALHALLRRRSVAASMRDALS
jgi:hypothetical protein